MTDPSASPDPLRDLLLRLRGWDMMDATADGPYWRAEIDKALAASAGRETRRACICAEPDPVMQADRKFYCHVCGYETGARPTCLEPEDMVKRSLAAGRETAPAKDVLDELHAVFTRNSIASYDTRQHPTLVRDVLRWAVAMCKQSTAGRETPAPPSEPPTDVTGQNRLLLNAYGRQCYDLGYAAGQSSASAPATHADAVQEE